MPIPVFQEAAKELIRQAAAHHKIKTKRVMQLFALSSLCTGPARNNFVEFMSACLVNDSSTDVQQSLRTTVLKAARKQNPELRQRVLRSQLKLTEPSNQRLRFLYDVIDQFYYSTPLDFDFEIYPKISDLFGAPGASPVSKIDQIDADADSTADLSFTITGPRKAATASSTPVDAKPSFLEHIAATTPLSDNEEDDTPEPSSLPKSSLVDASGNPMGVRKLILPDVQQIIKWGAQQLDAFTAVHTWLRTERNSRAQVFRMFGYAGVGKTAMARHIANFVLTEAGKKNIPVGEVLFAAYTGKACSVLRSKGCLNAATLHSLLYRPVIDPVTGICTSFVLNHESPLLSCSLLIVDEASMVPNDMAQDLLASGCLILVLGDPAQLPPVAGEGYFIAASPDVMLTDIRRQARDNPIIHLATRARNKKELKPGRYGDSVVYDHGKHVSDKMYVEHDQVLCGLNTTRRSVNKRSRRINGRAENNPIYPVKGDRLICLRNNKNSGLYNGTLWTASNPTLTKIMQQKSKKSLKLTAGRADVLAFKVRSVDERDQDGKRLIVKTQVSPHHFNPMLNEPFWRDIAGSDVFDFGYGMSVHKAQGSQYDSVLLMDESSTFKEDRWRHLYTGITRAAERISILK